MITYVLLSPTFGMHQYTADLANRMAQRGDARSASCDGSGVSCDVHLVTTTTLPRDRYAPAVHIHTPITARGTGFSKEGARPRAYRDVLREIVALAAPVVHFTGVHLWNPFLAHALRRRGIRVVHTLHDLAPHSGVPHGRLIRLWNRLVVASGATILVHGRCYRDQLIAGGLKADRVVYAPLLHGFWGWQTEEGLQTGGTFNETMDANSDGRPAGPVALFFGRLEWYKGVDTLLDAWRCVLQNTSMSATMEQPRLVLAGRLADGLRLPELPPGVELRKWQIDDAEALALFRDASLLVLPYRDATQTALIGASARLGLPVIVTRTGALPEYVVEGETGWVVPSDDPEALAAALVAALAGVAANPERLRQMGDAGQRWFAERRCEEETILTDLYRGLMC